MFDMIEEEKWVVKQIKFSNGDEIVCEQLIENNNDGTITLRNALLFEEDEESYDEENASPVFVLRPWMLYQSKINHIITVRVYSIVAELPLSGAMEEHFLKTLKDLMVIYSDLDEKDKLKTLCASDSDKPPAPSKKIIKFGQKTPVA